MNMQYQVRSRRLIKQLSIMMIVVLLTSLVAVGCTTPSIPPSVQPALLALIEEQPEQTLRLMVQARISETEMVDRVENLGGRLIYNLSMLDAYAVELPANAVPALAQTAGVRWVKLDAPVESSGKPVGTTPTTQVNTYLDTLGVRDVWAMGYNGSGVSVAVIDSGIAQHQDFDHLVAPGESSTKRSAPQTALAMALTLPALSAAQGKHPQGNMSALPQAQISSL